MDDLMKNKQTKKKTTKKTKTEQRPYLLVDWQCDIQVAHGSLRKAFGRFWLFQEGEAATRLLAHVSDLKHEEGKKSLRYVTFSGELCRFFGVTVSRREALLESEEKNQKISN